MIRWKDSVRFDDLHGAIVLALIRADALYGAVSADCWITSANDSTHMVGSKHYTGRAVDLRTHHIADPAVIATIATQLRTALGPQFTVLYESAGSPNQHLHLQFNGV